MTNEKRKQRDGVLTNKKRRKTEMGCVASKLDINDVHPNMFAVNNVDDVRFIFVFSSPKQLNR